MSLKITIFFIVLSSLCFALPFKIKPKYKHGPKSPVEYVKSFCVIRPKKDFCSEQNLRYMFWKQPTEYKRLIADLKLKSVYWADSNEILTHVKSKTNDYSYKYPPAKSIKETQNGKKMVKNIINELIRLFET
jgi:hypothetical protein